MTREAPILKHLGPWVLVLALLACGDDPSDAGGLAPEVTEIQPVTGLWAGTAESGDRVTISITEIRGDVGGSGTVVARGDTIDVAVEGRHAGTAITLHLTARGHGWDYEGTVGDATQRMRGVWSTFAATSALTLRVCAPADGC